jgi:hypothetical protein
MAMPLFDQAKHTPISIPSILLLCDLLNLVMCIASSAYFALKKKSACYRRISKSHTNLLRWLSNKLLDQFRLGK